MPVGIRPMTRADLDFAMEVKRAAGWNQTEADWRAHLALDPAGCLVAELDGEPAGTAVVTNYQDRFGWIGMVLVHPRFRRRGAGAALLRAACDHTSGRGIPQVRLDATPAGRQLYLTLGFTDEYPLTRYRAGAGVRHTASQVDAVDASGDVDLVARIVDWDATHFGTNRGPVLRELLTRQGSRAFCVHNGGSLSGFLITRLGSAATQLGPWVADNDDTAEALLRAALQDERAQEVLMDVPLPNTRATSLVEHYGFTAERGFTRMSRPGGHTPENNQRIYATAGADRG